MLLSCLFTKGKWSSIFNSSRKSLKSAYDTAKIVLKFSFEYEGEVNTNNISMLLLHDNISKLSIIYPDIFLEIGHPF